LSRKLWRLLVADSLNTQRLRHELRTHPAVAALLTTRGIRTREEALRFLRSRLRDLHEPDQLPGAIEAARRLQEAIRAGKRICVYGDYDVDGITRHPRCCGDACGWRALMPTFTSHTDWRRDTVST
jgi:single-stranded-DNA-specific exonuclease